MKERSVSRRSFSWALRALNTALTGIFRTHQVEMVSLFVHTRTRRQCQCHPWVDLFKIFGVEEFAVKAIHGNVKALFLDRENSPSSFQGKYRGGRRWSHLGGMTSICPRTTLSGEIVPLQIRCKQRRSIWHDKNAIRSLTVQSFQIWSWSCLFHSKDHWGLHGFTNNMLRNYLTVTSAVPIRA